MRFRSHIQWYALHRGLPRLTQRIHPRRDTPGVGKQAATRKKKEIGRSQSFPGWRSLSDCLPG